VSVLEVEFKTGLRATAKSPCLGGCVPDYVTEIGRPSGSVDAGRKESRVDKIEVVCGKREGAIQVIDLFGDILATVPRGVPRLNRVFLRNEHTIKILWNMHAVWAWGSGRGFSLS
jgi:hypothetical protein